MRAFLEDALTRFLQENGLLNVSAAAALAMAEARSAAPAPAAMDFSLNVTGIRPLESEIPEGEEASEESIEAEEEENTFAEYVAEPILNPDSTASRPSFRPFGIEYEGARQSVPVFRKACQMAKCDPH